MSEQKRPPTPPDKLLEGFWQEWRRQNGKSSRLAHLLLQRGRQLLERLQHFNGALSRLSLPAQRRWQHKLGTSLAGAALVLALSNAPAVYAFPATAEAHINGTDCLLVDAITAANTDTATGDCAAGLPGADTIELLSDVTLYSANNSGAYGQHGNGLPVITSQITIEGNGFTIARDPGAPAFRIALVGGSGNLTLNDTTISGGLASNFSTGGIANWGGTLTLNNSTVSNNSHFGLIGINGSTTSLTDSTVSGNGSGGLYNSGTATLTNCTISGNGGPGVVNGDYYSPTASSTLTNCTISGNSGAGVSNGGGNTTLVRSLIAGNTTQEVAVSYGTVNGNNFNVFGHSGKSNAQAFSNFMPSGSDLTLTSDSMTAVALAAILSPLADNGGGALTHALVTGSPAIDAAPTGPATDQRGVSRPQGAAFDIGAFEAVINARINGTDCDLVDAITAANTDMATGFCAAGTSGADTIELLSDVTLLSSADLGGTDFGPFGLPVISSPITIEGSEYTIARDANAPAFGILFVGSDGNLTLNDATISGAAFDFDTTTITFGGGIINYGGMLTLNNSTVSGNQNFGDGSAPFAAGITNAGMMTLNNSTVSGNQSTFIGGIASFGQTTLNNSTVSGNNGDFFGGIFNYSDLTLENSLISGNSGPAFTNEIANGGTVNADNFNLFGHDGESDAQAFYGFMPGASDLTLTSDSMTPVALATILSPLADNGGGTQTHALPLGSPALDAAPSGPATDQRGVARPQGCAFDIGAFELEWSPVCNSAPVATDDSYSTDEDTPLIVAAPGVLSNDTDVDNNPLTAQPVTGPAHGSLTLNADGSFTYTPDADYSGSDSFTYKANDGVGALGVDSNVATVNITVNAVNDAPAAMDDSYTTDEDTPLTIAAPGLLGNDSDVESDPLSAVLVGGPTNGSLTLNGDGSFTYTPNANFNGSDSFTYKANDGGADSNVATVSITVNAVNDAPTAAADSYSTDEDTALNVAAPGLLGNDSDVEGDALTAALVDAPLNGMLTFNADGSFTYTPDANFNGSDSFTYQVNDGQADSNVATVSLTVNAVNDAPLAADDSYLTDEDVPLTVVAPGVQDNDNDVDGDVLTSVLVSSPANGSVTLNGDGSFTYTPNADYNGSDSFTYKLNDGAADSNVATVTIVIGGVNDAPVAVNDSYSTDEDTALNVAAPGVLGNDSDVDNDPLTIALVVAPLNGSLTLNQDGSFSYTPDPDFNGSDSFSYQLNDGAATSTVATVSITVNPVNDAPVAANDSYNTNEDVVLNIAAPGVLNNDTDADDDALSAVVVSGPTNGSLTLNPDGSFSYTPNANFNGSDSFSYKVNDGTVDSNVATVALTIVPVNDAPVAGNDSYSTNEDAALNVAAPGVLGNDSDPVEGSPVTAVLVSGPAHGVLTLNANGSFSYTPAANYSGSDSFTYQANDGGANSNIATVSITVVSASSLIDDLIAKVQALVDSGVLNSGNGNALISKLENAKKKLMSGQPSVAINMMEAFINQVNALTGDKKPLSAAQAQALIDPANAIIASLN